MMEKFRMNCWSKVLHYDRRVRGWTADVSVFGLTPVRAAEPRFTRRAALGTSGSAPRAPQSHSYLSSIRTSAAGTRDRCIRRADGSGGCSSSCSSTWAVHPEHAADGEDRREEIDRDAERVVGRRGVEVDVRIQLLLGLDHASMRSDISNHWGWPARFPSSRDICRRCVARGSSV